MTVIAHGIDMVDCERLGRSIARHGRRFLQRIYTPAELAYCEDRKRCTEHLAGRFAVKEAVMKVLGTGWRGGIAWTDIEVSNDPLGRPEVVLSGRCRELADEMGLETILVAITHVETMAMASAIGCGKQREAASGPRETASG